MTRIKSWTTPDRHACFHMTLEHDTKVGLDARLLAGEEDDGETDIEKQKLDNNNTTTTTFPPTTQERRRREGFTDGLRAATCADLARVPLPASST